MQKTGMCRDCKYNSGVNANEIAVIINRDACIFIFTTVHVLNLFPTEIQTRTNSRHSHILSKQLCTVEQDRIDPVKIRIKLKSCAVKEISESA